MKFKVIYILLLLILSNNIFSNVKNGFIDLSGYNFEKLEPVNLRGEWELRVSSKDREYSQVPGNWGERYGSATYSLIILSSGSEDLIFAPSQINTECKIYLNGNLIAQSKKNRSLFIPIDLKKGRNSIQIRIKNYTDLNPGIRSNPYIGSYKKVLNRHEKEILQDTISSGASFVIFIFFTALFLYYTKDKSTLYFGLICLFLFIRGFVVNDKIIYSFIPTFPYIAANRLEYLSIYILPMLLILFNKSYFKLKWKLVSKALFISSLFLPILALITKAATYMSFLYVFYIYALIVSLYLIISLIYYTILKLEDAFKILISIITLLIASILDIYIAINNLPESLVLSRFMIVFILFMSFTVSHKQIRNLLRIKKLTKENRDVNNYLHKFIPNDFIKHIGKGDITSTELGDGVEKSMTVLFASLKDFYKQSRLLNGKEVISLLNRYLSLVSPVIIKHGGFVDKFMDETIMALFPDNPQNAIDAALEISMVLTRYNYENSRSFQLNIQSGIHLGSLYIGVVGDERRFDATVISKTVNSASRISTFSKKIDKEILISKDVFDKIDQDSYKINYMGRVKLKGNNESIGIYNISTDLLNRDPFQLTQADNLFSITMKKLEDCSLDKIEDVLWKIKGICPVHTPTLYYLKLIKENKKIEDLEK